MQIMSLFVFLYVVVKLFILNAVSVVNILSQQSYFLFSVHNCVAVPLLFQFTCSLAILY